VATGLVRGEPPTFTLVYVEATDTSPWSRLWRRVRPDQAGRNLQEHLDLIKAYAEEKQARVDVRRSAESDVTGFVCREAAHGAYDLVLVGAGLKNPLRSAVTTGLLERAPCHVAIVRGRGSIQDCKRLLVATNGSYFSRAALEVAILYAEKIGASITVLYTLEDERVVGDDEDTQPT